MYRNTASRRECRPSGESLLRNACELGTHRLVVSYFVIFWFIWCVDLRADVTLRLFPLAFTPHSAYPVAGFRNDVTRPDRLGSGGLYPLRLVRPFHFDFISLPYFFILFLVVVFATFLFEMISELKY